jgi:hypothetical protein
MLQHLQDGEKRFEGLDFELHHAFNGVLDWVHDGVEEVDVE